MLQSSSFKFLKVLFTKNNFKNLQKVVPQQLLMFDNEGETSIEWSFTDLCLLK